MKRNWNSAVWTGASLVFLGVISYPLFFVRFPALRDFPWANLPMIALGLVLLALGLVRAFRRSDLFRGKISGSVLAVLALAFSGFFLYGILSARGICYPLRTARRRWARWRQISRCRIRRTTQ
jgi:hypothetical protein